LRRDGLAVDRHNLLHPKDKKSAYLSEKLKDFDGSFLAVSDYMRTVQDQIAPWIPNGFSSLGTDGVGLSDTRGALRRHFKIDGESITVGVLAQLANEGKISAAKVQAALDKYRLNDVSAADPGNTEGTG
ncbi:MAG: pyruvate dehydrogenase (acetyl-transferring), homodimeric type, partial [Actinomycetota bacterium]